MAVSLDEFVDGVIATGLRSKEEMSDYLDTFPPEKRPGDAEALARQMVRDGKLTQLQATTVLESKQAFLVFGDYVLLEKVGEGGVGEVFKASHRRADRVVALKVLRSESLDSPDMVKRFHQEVKVAARLTHPNIIATFDASQQDGLHFLVMEYVDGCDLAALVRGNGPLSVSQALDYVIQTAQGLDHAHREGIVHRDVKPANLLLDRDGTIKILDMGLARITDRDEDVPVGATLEQRLTKRGQVLGTVDYMSPEQATDTRGADHRSDVYSLGCTLYSLLTNKPVYTGDSAIMKLMAHCEAEIPALDALCAEVPARLNKVFAKMVAKKPDDRYQSMSEVIADLKACLEAAQSTGGSRPSATTAGPDRPVSPPIESGTVVEQDTEEFLQKAAPQEDVPVAGNTGELAGANTVSSIEKPPITAATGHRKLLWIIVGVGVVAVLGVLAVLVF